MDRLEVEALATYKAEVERGIVHTRYFDDKMRRAQMRFNDEQFGSAERCRADDGVHPDCNRPRGHSGDHMDPDGCTWARRRDDRASV